MSDHYTTELVYYLPFREVQEGNIIHKFTVTCTTDLDPLRERDLAGEPLRDRDPDFDLQTTNSN
jgi:hypothetical protein